MSRFEIEQLPLEGLRVIKRKPIGDQRGFLTRLFCASDLADSGWSGEINQINHTLTSLKGTVRGMHFQHLPHSEQKLVNCVRGEIFDVAVDIRQNSPTYLQWHGEILSADNQKSLLIPEGFAHGFQTLTDNVELIYFHSSRYVADSEGALNATDPGLAINWPLEITERSVRDTKHPPISAGFTGLKL